MADPFFTFDGRVHPICQIGMGEVRTAEPASWFDVSCYVHEAELFRGRERFNERFEPGTASVTFDNRSGWADLGGTYTEVAAAQLRPGRHIRIGVEGPWDPGLAPYIRWLYRGFIDQATPTYDPTLHDVVTVNCIDALGEAGSSTAPTGDLQGINETVSQRLNRVLDAVGWWGSKRKIDATATTVQGTELGQAAVDHLGQAADSAGGVVFGDLDGDVVFRDIDWMLYDPDVPPDDEIGPGPPGPPPTDLPPYIDPTPGPVHDPDDPPSLHPPKVCVCADGTAGTLVEKGDNYRLYVLDGHLFYESSGTTWDMGPYSGGCTCVDPDGPERSDDPDEDGDYDISPFPPVELPSQFGVELLEWNDGGLADPPAAAVTVTGIAPGHDCLLVVMVNALGTATNATGLAPTVTGGGLDWAHRRDADQAAEGASSFMMLAPVGRDDPGTFDVVVTWAAGMTSRSHIVTVWKVTAAVDNYLERFDAGLVLYALTDSNPPDEIEPGDGFQAVDLAADETPADVDGVPRMVDITIAQSLAEESLGPFGANFVETNGPWVIPPIVPVASPTLLVGEVFVDDFERASLGSDWTPSSPGAAPPASPFGHVIVDGAVETTVSGDTYAYERRGIFRTDNVVALDEPAFIEVVFEGLDVGGVYPFSNATLSAVSLYLRATGHTQHIACDIIPYPPFDPLNPTLPWGTHVGFGSAGGGIGDAGTYIHDPAELAFLGMGLHTLRFESDPNVGAGWPLRCYIDDVLVHSYTAASSYIPAPTATRVGLTPTFWTNLSGTPNPSPRILSATGGAGGGRVMKTSWIAGWRAGSTQPQVMLEDVNFGEADIQSAQACLVLESAATESGWRILGHDLRATPAGVTAAGVLTFDQAPRPGSLVVVFVGVTAPTDVLGSISVTGADFTVARAQPKTGSSLGQGAVYTAVAPLDLVEDSWAILVTYPTVESISVVVYEVTDQDDEGPLGATASGVLGTGTAGSVNGPSTITLSAAGDAAAVVLAYLHVAADPSPSSGAGTVDGDEWHEEFQSSTAARGYFQTMSRAPGQPESTSTAVHWDDVQTGTADTYSAVQLAVEIHPYDGLPPLTGAGSGVTLGGATDPWNGIIRTAAGYDPVTGAPIWSFP